MVSRLYIEQLDIAKRQLDSLFKVDSEYLLPYNLANFGGSI